MKKKNGIKNNKNIKKTSNTKIEKTTSTQRNSRIINPISTTNKRKYNNIPNIISEMLILLYALNKDIRKKRIKDGSSFYLINSNFLNQIKNLYNYPKVCEELDKMNYTDIESKVEIIKSEINIKNIINEEIEIENVKISPIIKKLYSINHLVDFSIVNQKILDIITKLKTHFNLEEKIPTIQYKFYFNPEIFYVYDRFLVKGKYKSYIKIISLNDEDSFSLKYFIIINFYKVNLKYWINEIVSSKNINSFFKKYNIKNDKGRQNLIYNSVKCGEIINFSIPETNINEINSINIITDNKEGNSNFNYFEITKPYRPPISSEEDNLDNFYIKSIAQIQSTPMIGLKNIGQTCYMNAALQCFSNTKSLTKYFLNIEKLIFIKNNTVKTFGEGEPQLVVEYLKLIRHLWGDNPKSSYAPYEFKQKIGIIEPLFKNFEANDAKDFVNFMVMRMHEELNNVDGNLTKQNNIIEPALPLNPYNQSQVLQFYMCEFQRNFNSFISNCFYGTTQGEFECQNCKSMFFQMGQNVPLVKYNYQTFFFLNFPLDEVRKYILSDRILCMKYMNSNVDPNLVVNLYDCFYYYQKDDLLSCYCDRCQNENAQVISKTKLFIAPIYLIILLNRGKGIEFDIKITFPEKLSTNGIFMNPCGDYYLYGVVKHFGGNNSSGHFTAYCRSPIDNMWYFYNDDTVVPVKENEKYKIEENGHTYMLFYSQMNK